MENELYLNRKLFSFNGVIGRRDYIINLFIIGMISQLFTIPQFYGGLQTVDFNAPVFLSLTNAQKILMFISTLICVPISFSNVTRRLSDIYAKKADTQMYIFCVVFFLMGFFLLFIPLKNIGAIYLVLAIISLFLMIKKGEVTGKYPADPVKRFNWGAFWGTWIWGLFNKSFITLWEIPLLLTPCGWLVFPLICGLKGNEWAYKNKQCSDVEVFHKSQQKQSVIFGVVMIGMFLLMVFFMVALSAAVTISYLSKPENRGNVQQKITNFIDATANKTFTKIEFTKNENKVYINPVEWKKLQVKEKINAYKFACSYAMTQRSEKTPKLGSEEIMKIPTVIYSDYNNEVLASFERVPVDENDRLIEKIKKEANSYHFNNNPQIPPKEGK